ILEEVFAIYAARRSGGDAQLHAPLPYRRYVEWEGLLRPEDAAAHWRSTLAGFEAATSEAARVLTSDSPIVREAVLRLPPAETQRLNSFARQHRLTVNTLVQGAWGLVLARRSGRYDVLA